MRFAHIADTHVGYNQYGSDTRFNDFGYAWLWCCESIKKHNCDFVIHAGDLFDSVDVKPETLSQVEAGLNMLSCPVYITEGNHEQAHSVFNMGWLDYLEDKGLLEIIQSNAPVIMENIAIYGFPWSGSSTNKVLSEQRFITKGFNILMFHGAVEGMTSMLYPGTVSMNNINTLPVDYVALGHIHKPFQQGKVYNPGSTESKSIEEAMWDDRGFYIVDTSPLHIQKIINPKRPFVRVSVRNEQDLEKLIVEEGTVLYVDLYEDVTLPQVPNIMRVNKKNNKVTQRYSFAGDSHLINDLVDELNIETMYQRIYDYTESHPN